MLEQGRRRLGYMRMCTLALHHYRLFLGPAEGAARKMDRRFLHHILQRPLHHTETDWRSIEGASSNTNVANSWSCNLSRSSSSSSSSSKNNNISAPPLSSSPTSPRSSSEASSVSSVSSSSSFNNYVSAPTPAPASSNLSTWQWGNDPDIYRTGEKIGKGRYSDVYAGVNTRDNNSLCVIKILKPVKEMKIEREVKVLRHLNGGPNIIHLIDVVRDPSSGTTSLILEHAHNSDYKKLYPTFSLRDIKFYCYELLKAISFAHSRGVMHRDIKPLNIAIDHNHHYHQHQQKGSRIEEKDRGEGQFFNSSSSPTPNSLRLLDWGLAEFYRPGESYSCRVSTRHYKAPELLVDFDTYDYSVDLWSFGCILAAMVFRKESFFQSKDNVDQLGKIIYFLGSDSFNEYVDKFDIQLSESLHDVTRVKRKRKKWDRYINDDNKHLVTAEGLDLLDKLLRYDHTSRLTAEEAMLHPFFKDCNNFNIVNK